MAKSNIRALKYPVLKNVKYISILKNKKSVLEIDGKDVEGLEWRDFGIYLGNHLPIARYFFTMGFNNKNEVFSGQIRAISTDNKKNESNEMESNQLTSLFNDLKADLKKATDKGGISFDMLLQATKQGYEAQISFLTQQVAHKDNLINKFESEIDDLEDDLENCIKENSKTSSLSQYIEIGQKLLTTKFGNKEAATLKESNPKDIPDEIINILGAVDYSKIDDESMRKIVSGLRQYISLLPLKG